MTLCKPPPVHTGRFTPSGFRLLFRPPPQGLPGTRSGLPTGTDVGIHWPATRWDLMRAVYSSSSVNRRPTSSGVFAPRGGARCGKETSRQTSPSSTDLILIAARRARRSRDSTLVAEACIPGSQAPWRVDTTRPRRCAMTWGLNRWWPEPAPLHGQDAAIPAV